MFQIRAAVDAATNSLAGLRGTEQIDFQVNVELQQSEGMLLQASRALARGSSTTFGDSAYPLLVGGDKERRHGKRNVAVGAGERAQRLPCFRQESLELALVEEAA